ncbi:MAG: SusC/RagA family TonB-linked outer membrane protein [Bacteroidaceae bacterium]|nr:SusC/RagA family TonB-linked outer membrane protein [Bacteroidaceae bacterium]
MNKITKLILLWVIALMALPASAQQRRISGTVSDDIDVIIGANVVEKDKNNRIVSQTVTDMNGNFTMNIKDPNNTLTISYIGYRPYVVKLGGKNVYKVTLVDATKEMKVVDVVAKKKAPTTGLEIPEREYSGAVQKFSMEDMEGLAFESVDQALQGQIAGLDIVPNSGNLGSGTTMRLRGISTINGNKQPLIVLNDHIFEIPDEYKDENFEDYDNEEQFSTLLSVNPEDIESVTVLKDAASTAKWGMKGAAGVIEIKTKRGVKGKTRVNFSYKFTGTWQPEGYKMLDGDGYTMYMKESYYNPYQRPTTEYGLYELDYDRSKPNIYYNYNKNTDWVKEVKQFGQEHRFSLNLNGGGEKATFRISANYDKSAGNIIGQSMDRFTTNTALDYWVSDRIKFSSTIDLGFYTNNKNYGNDILDRAYKAMPNMSVWEYDSNGDPTGNYFNMLPLAALYSKSGYTRQENNGYKTSFYLRDMFRNGNPVARAMEAWWKMSQYNLKPQFSIEYKLLGKESDQWRLDYVGDVELQVFNTSNDDYCPSDLKPMAWVWGGDNQPLHQDGNPKVWIPNERNYVSNKEEKTLQFSTRHDLRFYSAFPNKDHSLSALARFEITTGSGTQQKMGLWNVPDQITDPTVIALLREAETKTSEWRSQSFFFNTHYSYKSKYNLDASLRIDGSTAFGSGHKYASFPSVAVRWNVSDEKFMDWSKKWLQMFGLRASWGIVGNTGGSGSDQYNKYKVDHYYNGHQVIVPENLSLTDLRWEKVYKMNLGFNLELFGGMLNFDGEMYNHKTTDLIMEHLRISGANGFDELKFINGGVMRNTGWEINFSTGKICKIGKFSMKLRGNLAQNFNEVEEMNPLILENLNGSDTYQPENLGWNRRVQIGNALGSFYGLHYLGVYRYDYDHNGYTTKSISDYGYAEVNNSGCDAKGNPINTAAAAARRGENATCPIAYDADGNMLTNAKGEPLPMYYCYNEGYRKKFSGGDAIYEDINHDGQIDRYDMVYLGNSNPKCNGGFGIQLYYGKLSINAGFNFRMGNMIFNYARMEYESMYNNNNQSYASTWRWRKNGDITTIPRALNNYGTGYKSYNSLMSDRYIEEGDYLRLQYIQVSYDFDAKKLKKYHLKSMKLFASISNPFVWSRYTGVDPDVSPSGYDCAVDKSKTPRNKSFTCSLNIGF